MKKNTIIIFLSVFIIVTFLSCKCHKNTTQGVALSISPAQGVAKVTAPVIIYKTNEDFYQRVPVMLNDDKTDIISYPDIKDVYYNGELAYPTRLENGFLLDNRGIGKNVAFLTYSYEEYSKLAATPSKDELMSKIINKNPLIALYRCDKLQKKNILMLNDAIKKGLPNVCENLIK